MVPNKIGLYYDINGGGNILIDSTTWVNNMNNVGQLTGSCTHTFIQNKMYRIYAFWKNSSVDYKFSLSWEYS